MRDLIVAIGIATTTTFIILVVWPAIRIAKKPIENTRRGGDPMGVALMLALVSVIVFLAQKIFP